MIQVLIVGLGNPGKKFEYTRHNLGVLAVREWFTQNKSKGTDVSDWQVDKKINAEIATVTLDKPLVSEETTKSRAMPELEVANEEALEEVLKVTCLFPLTYMNKSGEAIAAISKKKFFFSKPHFSPNNILIVHDDIELPFGDAKIKKSGSAAGHNGVRSVQQILNTTELPRLRLGIGKPTQNIDRYVLQRFNDTEKNSLGEFLNSAANQINKFIENKASA